MREENTRVPSQSLHFDQNLCSPVQTPQHLRERLLKVNIGSFKPMVSTHDIFFQLSAAIILSAPLIMAGITVMPMSWWQPESWEPMTYMRLGYFSLFTLPIIRICAVAPFKLVTTSFRSLDIDPQLLDELFKVGNAQTNIPGMTMRKQLQAKFQGCLLLFARGSKIWTNCRTHFSFLGHS